jgi:hypothetical protein
VTGLFLQRLDALVPAADIDALAVQIALRALDPRAAAGQALARVCPARDR